jgi:hypothetical protein
MTRSQSPSIANYAIYTPALGGTGDHQLVA